MSAPVRKPGILVVEDDAALLGLYGSALEAAGYDVVTVGDGLAALLHLDEAVPDIVVLDLNLPRVDGREVYRELASNPATAQLPVIVVTGSTLTEREEQEFSCVLRKPVQTDTLIREIQKRVRIS